MNNLAGEDKKVNFITSSSMSNEPHFGRNVTSRSCIISYGMQNRLFRAARVFLHYDAVVFPMSGNTLWNYCESVLEILTHSGKTRVI